MNRLLAAALEALNVVIVLVLIAGGAFVGWLFFQGDPGGQNIGIVTGGVLGLLTAVLVGGAISLVILIEKHLRAIRTNAEQQTELLTKLAAIAEGDANAAAYDPGDGGFGAPAWARTGRGG